MTETMDIRRMFHDLRNTLGAVELNLEIAADSSLASGMALEAAVDALSETRRLKDEINGIRQAVWEPTT